MCISFLSLFSLNPFFFIEVYASFNFLSRSLCYRSLMFSLIACSYRFQVSNYSSESGYVWRIGKFILVGEDGGYVVFCLGKKRFLVSRKYFLAGDLGLSCCFYRLFLCCCFFCFFLVDVYLLCVFYSFEFFFIDYGNNEDRTFSCIRNSSDFGFHLKNNLRSFKF